MCQLLPIPIPLHCEQEGREAAPTHCSYPTCVFSPWCAEKGWVGTSWCFCLYMLMDEWEESVKVRWDKESQTNPKHPDRVSTNNRQKICFYNWWLFSSEQQQKRPLKTLLAICLLSGMYPVWSLSKAALDFILWGPANETLKELPFLDGRRHSTQWHLGDKCVNWRSVKAELKTNLQNRVNFI